MMQFQEKAGLRKEVESNGRTFGTGNQNDRDRILTSQGYTYLGIEYIKNL